METRQKRYCPHCGDRIRHSATRCHHCGKLTLSWKNYLAVGVIALAAIVLLLKVMGLL